MPTIQEIEDQYLVPLYTKRDVALVRGEGCWVFDTEGKKYIDFMSNYGPNILGHGNKEFSKTVKEQFDIFISCHQSFYNDKRAALIQAYLPLLPQQLSRFFFSNSGTESVEAALKFVRVASGKKHILSTKKAYHGRTLGALAATGADKYKTPYEPLMEGFLHVEYGNIEAVKAVFDDFKGDVAAIILEPIQGEGGIIIPPEGFLQEIRTLCDNYGVYLILDEVQTSYRTGKLLAFEHFNVVPDVVCISKAIANGLPMGLTIVTDEIALKVPKGTHGNTFGANPLVCTAALSTLQYLLKYDIFNHSATVGDYFIQKLRGIDADIIRDVRGKGLMVALELRDRVTKYLKKMQQNGLLALPAGSTIIRFLPPLIISKEEIDYGMDIIKASLKI